MKRTREFAQFTCIHSALVCMSSAVIVVILYLWSATAQQNFLIPRQRLIAVILASTGVLSFYISYRLHRLCSEDHARRARELSLAHRELASLYQSTIESLACAIDARDSYMRRHATGVENFAAKIARALGMPDDEIEGVKIAALLHDIGKLGVPEHILLKPGRLSPEEYAKVRSHAEIGAGILEHVRFPWPVAEYVRSHHERWDGSGYPDGLAGDRIPIGARILAVADVYDALTSKRAYREHWSHRNAIEHIKLLAGIHFDPAVVNALMSIADDLSENSEESIEASEISAPVEKHCRRDAAAEIASASRELAALSEIAPTLSASLNLQEVLILLANKVRNVVRCTTCVIFLREGDREGILKARVAAGGDEEQFIGAVAQLGEGRTGSVAITGEAWTGRHDPSDLIFQSGKACQRRLKSALIAPLWTERKIIGTINLYSEYNNQFTPEDISVLNVVGRHAGAAIENARLFETTRECALRDPLTGLYNARFLFTFLEQELSRARRYGRPLSVLGIDLDNFKQINDAFGHEQGDIVLKDVAECLQQQVREYDVVVRYSGDEFIIVLPETSAEEARRSIMRIKQAVSEYATRLPKTGGPRLGVSIGLATCPEDGAELRALLAKADASMYEDKRALKAKPVAA